MRFVYRDIQDWGTASCYFCFHISTAEEISAFVDGGLTPMCPNCNMDCLIPGEESKERLTELYKEAFEVCSKTS